MVLPLLALCAGLIFSFAGWRFSSRQIHERDDQRFERVVEKIRSETTERFDDYTRLLSGARGLFAASKSVERGEWKAFSASYDLIKDYPGALGMGFIQRVPREKFQQFLTETRADDCPEFQSKPSSDQSSNLYVIKYVEPIELNRAALGFEISNEPLRMAAARTAMLTGRPAITAPLQLLQAKAGQTGFVLYLPVYRNGSIHETEKEREAALEGWVFLPLLSDSLLKDVPSHVEGLADLEVFERQEGGATNRLYSTPPRAAGFVPLYTRDVPIPVASRTWVLHISSQPEFEAQLDTSSPVIFLFGGIMCSLAFFIALLRVSPTVKAGRHPRSVLVKIVLVVGAIEGLLMLLLPAFGSLSPVSSSILNACILTLIGTPAVYLFIIRPMDAEISKRILFAEKMAQLATEQSERARAIIATAVDGIVVTDLRGSIEIYNPAAERVFGYNTDEAGKLNLSSLIPELDGSGSRVLEPFQRDASGRPQERQMAAKHKDGRTIPIEISVTEAKFAEERKFVAIVRDISERKKAEEELIRARNAAEAAARAKSEFLATMSHEIRTPMNGVIGMTGLLLDTPLDNEQRDFANTIKNSADALLTIINDILDFSKIEAGKLTMEPIPFNLQASCDEVAELLTPKTSEKHLEFVVRYAPDLPTRLIGDPGRIRQILVNLIGNAIKFTESGYVLLDVSCQEVKDGKAMLYFQIMDTGIGIPEDKQDGLFQKFTQVDATTTRKFGGTGLGLAICRSLSEMMGGSIGLRSSYGKGSTFWFTLHLPLDTREVEAPPPPAMLENIRVLLVDDLEVNRKVFKEMMLHWGMRCDTAESAPQALEFLTKAKAANDPYQAAVLDWLMPDMDGLDLARAIKGNPELKHTRLLLLTSAASRGDGRKVMDAGFSAFLIKPVRQHTLREALARILGLNRGDKPPTGLVTRHSLHEDELVPMQSQSIPLRRSYRVLLTDDNPINQKVAQRQLEKLGCRVELAGNGKEALDMIEKIPFGLVFMDCQMPEMDGFEATTLQRAREQKGARRVPIVAMTANAMQGDRDRCLASGMDDYVSKPVQVEELKRVIERWALSMHPDPSKSAAQPAVTAAVPVPASVPPPLAPPLAVEQPAFDPAAVQELRELMGMGDQDFLDTIIKPFVASASVNIQNLRQALQQNDAVGCDKAAHSLKGSAGTVGAKKLSQLAAHIMELARQNNVPKIHEEFPILVREFVRVKMYEESFTKDSTQSNALT